MMILGIVRAAISFMSSMFSSGPAQPLDAAG